VLEFVDQRRQLKSREIEREKESIIERRSAGRRERDGGGQKCIRAISLNMKANLQQALKNTVLSRARRSVTQIRLLAFRTQLHKLIRALIRGTAYFATQTFLSQRHRGVLDKRQTRGSDQVGVDG